MDSKKSPIYRLLFENSIRNGEPIFKRQADLARVIATMPNSSYASKGYRVVATLLSQTMNGGMPTRLLRKDIIEAVHFVWEECPSHYVQEIENSLPLPHAMRVPSYTPLKKSHLLAIASQEQPTYGMLYYLQDLETHLGISLSEDTCCGLLQDYLHTHKSAPQ